MAGIKILACKMGKHDWQKVPVKDNKYEMWVCSVCGEKKHHLNFSADAAPVETPDASGSAEPTATAAAAAPMDDMPAMDELTGFLSKKGALDYINDFLKKHKRDSLTICMSDIDSLRTVNETWGNERGDQVIRECADIIRKEISDMGTPCRWGGDEFLLIFPSQNGDDVYNRLFTLREKIKTRVIYYDGDGISVTMTFGIAEYGFSGTVDELVAEAEDRLSLGKQMGGNQVIF